MNKNETLMSLEVLAGMTEEQFAALGNYTEVVTCKKGEPLFKVGNAASQVYFLLEGKVGVQVQLSSRPETVSLVVLSQLGQLVGWSGMFEGAHYTATGVCIEDSTLLSIDGKQFTAILEQDPAAGFDVMRQISFVISERMRNLQSVVLKTM